MLLTWGGILAVIVTVVVLETYGELKDPLKIECPRDGLPARVQVDAIRAAAASAIGARGLKVAACSRWPARGDCDRSCIRKLNSL
jgi:hypothetical protein